MKPPTVPKTLIFVVCLAGVVGCGSDGLPDGNGGPVGDNRAPVINPVSPQQVLEGESLRIVFTVSDPDGDTLYLEADPLPDDATFDPIQGTLQYDPDFDVVQGGESSLTLPDIVVTVDDREDPRDRSKLSDSTTLSITVINVNQRPFFLASDGSRLTALEAQVDPATEETLRFQVVDLDGDEVTLSLSGSAAWIRLSGESLVLSPTEADRGSISELEIVATDGTDSATLPVRVVVGNLEAELPPPEGLDQRNADGIIAVGANVFEGTFIFQADAHDFPYAALRLQIEVAEIGQLYEDGTRSIDDAVAAGIAPEVMIDLDGGASYRWRARYLSDEFGASAYTSFGGNADSEADLVVSIVPETVLDVVPHDPSPVDVDFEYYSPNVTDFECQLDDEAFVACNTRVTCCPGGDCGDRTECEDETCTCARWSLIGLDNGSHSVTVRALTRDALPDPTPETFEWQVLDQPIPTTSLDSFPSPPVGCTAQFGFSSSDPNATFECRLDCQEPPPRGFTGQYLPCTSPKTYSGLLTGSYRFWVRAVNLVGQADESPANHPFSTTCSE